MHPHTLTKHPYTNDYIYPANTPKNVTNKLGIGLRQQHVITRKKMKRREKLFFYFFFSLSL